MKRLILLVVLLAVLPLSSYAWNHEGHRTVAAIAYNQLTSTQKERINAILRNHPFYEEFWLPEYKAAHIKPSEMSFEEYAFIRAAGWPDDVRGDEFKDEYHNGTWHYVNFPTTPPNSLDTDEAIGTGVLLEQIEACAKSVEHQTSNSKRERRAIMLAWLLHLVGDLHQPLHTVALVNNTYPDGDHGGNFFFVRRSSKASGMKLHAFWDGLLGNSMVVADAAELARTLQSDFPKTNQMISGDFNDWSKESARLGLDSAYQFKGVSIRGGTSKKSAKILPAGYAKDARDIARKQIAGRLSTGQNAGGNRFVAAGWRQAVAE
jgi:S1/P1 Nuclease